MKNDLQDITDIVEQLLLLGIGNRNNVSTAEMEAAFRRIIIPTKTALQAFDNGAGSAYLKGQLGRVQNLQLMVEITRLQLYNFGLLERGNFYRLLRCFRLERNLKVLARRYRSRLVAIEPGHE